MPDRLTAGGAIGMGAGGSCDVFEKGEGCE
jgi:hypothetical protein